jgi:signal transduction histidine kinase
MALLRDDETSKFECRVRHSSGDWYWILIRNKIFARNKDGSVREVIGTTTDITERKQAEENAKFINVLNQAMRPLADPEEIKATAARILGEYLGADRCAYAEIEAGENYLDITCDYTRGETPSIVGRFGVDDLGPEVLRLMRLDLPSVVNDIEAETSAKTDLSAFRRAEIRALVCAPIIKHGRFVARMSVQQKTPCRWLGEEVELIKVVASRCWESVARARALRRVREGEERLRRITEATQDALWEIDLKTRRLWWSEGAKPLSQTRLVNDILDTSRIITGSLKLDARPVEIERVFQAAVDVIRPSAKVKGVTLAAVIDDHGDVVFGDAGRLQQAIWNLLSNAVKFTNEGGRIEARLRRAGNQVEITVSDTGIGIEPQFLPHVFERFRQADSASTRKYSGLGLGLAIAHHIIELHGGGVSASSPGRDQGATFRIRLPLLESGYQTHVSKPVDPGELIAMVASLTGRIHF